MGFGAHMSIGQTYYQKEIGGDPANIFEVRTPAARGVPFKLELPMVRPTAVVLRFHEPDAFVAVAVCV